MNKLHGMFLLCYIILVAFILIDKGTASNTQSLHRPRRFLSFPNITRFFLRINFKANMVPWNQIFAQAVGFRINWDCPPDSFHPYHHFSRRSLYSNMELLLDRNGLNGFHCVRRAVCEVQAITESSEIYHRILKIVFRLLHRKSCLIATQFPDQHFRCSIKPRTSSSPFLFYKTISTSSSSTLQHTAAE